VWSDQTEWHDQTEWNNFGGQGKSKNMDGDELDEKILK
jgi:hypothetical protein